jgi:hypothetical protein
MDSNLETPVGLVVTAVTEGLNRIEFSGVGENSYEIWRRHGDTVDWYLHSTTERPTFEDSDVKPGQYYEYKIRAINGEAVSDFSPSAVVYGK